jgi:hypothetical protein
VTAAVNGVTDDLEIPLGCAVLQFTVDDTASWENVMVILNLENVTTTIEVVEGSECCPYLIFGQRYQALAIQGYSLTADLYPVWGGISFDLNLHSALDA